MNEGDRSLLLFTTPVDAHGLYDFLLALGPRLTAAVDVPTLLSDDAFAGMGKRDSSSFGNAIG